MARRTKGEGSITKLQDGSWRSYITTGYSPATGKPIRKYFYGKTRREVADRMRRANVEMADGTYIEPSKYTVGQWCDIWLSEFCIDVKQSTRISYSQHIKNHIKPALGAVKLSALTVVMVQTFYNDLSRKDKPLSPKTIKNVHGVLHQALKQAVDVGYIRANPADRCKLPRIERKEIVPLTIEEQKRLFAVLSGNPFECLIKVTLFTGMREGEILGLRWSCIDFQNKTITVDKQLSRPRRKGDVYQLTTTKNGKARLICPADSVFDLLREHRKKQTTERLRLGMFWDDGGFPDLVFTNPNGSHLCYNPIIKHFHAVLSEAGIPKKRFHDLRHTFAVNSLRFGDNVKTVQENLGHFSAAFTLDTYGHVTDEMRRDSASHLEKVFQAIK